MKRSALILVALAALAGCDPLLGGRCAGGWVPSPGACDAGAALDAADDRPDVGDDRPDVGDALTDAATDALTDLGDGRPDVTDAVTDVAPPGDVLPMDGGPMDGSVLDGGPTDAARTDATPTDAPVTDSGCTPPQTLCAGACVDTASSRSHCGACGRACAAGEFCASGVCSARCSPPLLLCDGVCLDPLTDPQNCGGCGVVCSTGICNGGRCRDARAGHLVLIGHDYDTTRPDQDRVVGNAVFLGAASAPRVATCTLGARPSSVTNVREAIRRVAGLRAWREAVLATPDELVAAFSVDATDIVLIHHQPDATAAAVEALAVRIAGPAVGFVRAGGVVVVLDGEGSSPGTWPMAEATGLLTVTGHVAVTGEAAEVVGGADAVAIGLPVAYRAERGSVTFLGTDGTGVVIRSGMLPLVLHRVVFGL